MHACTRARTTCVDLDDLTPQVPRPDAPTPMIKYAPKNTPQKNIPQKNSTIHHSTETLYTMSRCHALRVLNSALTETLYGFIYIYIFYTVSHYGFGSG